MLTLTEVLGKLVGRKSWGHCAASATTKHGAARWERAGYRNCAAGTTDWARELVTLLGGRELDADNVSLVIGESRTLTLGRWRKWLGERAGDTVSLVGCNWLAERVLVTLLGGREQDADTVPLALQHVI